MGGRLGRKPETLQDLLDDEAITLLEAPRFDGRNHGGHRSKMRCPACDGGRERERNFFVLFDTDGKGFRWICHRASCGVTGGRRLNDGQAPPRPPWRPKDYRRPAPAPQMARPDSVYGWFERFGISRATVDDFGIYRIERPMPVLDQAGKEQDRWAPWPTLVYPYRQDHEVLNRKYKAVYPWCGKKRFIQEKDAEPSLYNIDNFHDDELGIFVEGEDDCLALWECGFRQVTTLVDGSPPRVSESYSPETDHDERYIAIRGNANPKIARLRKIVLGGDMDEAGRRHHEEIARRLGKERCWIVSWPSGCKDAKDTLQKLGPEAVHHAIEHAEPYPLEGLLIMSETALEALWEGRRDRRFTTGRMLLDERLSLPDSGGVIALTGIPGHGKSSLAISYATMVAEKVDQDRLEDPSLPVFHAVVFSGEVANARVAANLLSAYSNKAFFPHRERERLSMAEVRTLTNTWLRRHFTFIDWPDRAEPPPLTWVLERARQAIRRTGAKLLILDPWQEIDDELPGDWRRSTSDWIGRVLQRINGFAQEHAVNVLIVVHPAKGLERYKDGSYTVPDGYNIYGSQSFFSRVDIGLTSHRPDATKSDMLIKTWKSKYQPWVKLGESLFRFDVVTGRIEPMPVGLDALGEPLPPAATNAWYRKQDEV